MNNFRMIPFSLKDALLRTAPPPVKDSIAVRAGTDALDKIDGIVPLAYKKGGKIVTGRRILMPKVHRDVKQKQKQSQSTNINIKIGDTRKRRATKRRKQKN